MMREMTSLDYSEWMVYETIEPFGEKAQNNRTAIMCWVLGNMFAGKSKQIPFEKFADFFEVKSNKESVKENYQGMMDTLMSTLGSPLASGERGKKKRKMIKIADSPRDKRIKRKRKKRRMRRNGNS